MSRAKAFSIKQCGVTALAVLTVCAFPAEARDEPQADPSAYLQAFSDLCLRDFPNFDRIAAHATASGWQGSELHAMSGGLVPDELPHAFQKDGLMLFLTRPTSGSFRQVCQVTGSRLTKASGTDIAAVVSPLMGNNTPVPDKGRGRDAFIWTTGPGTSVQAGISIYGRTKTISLIERLVK